VQFVYNYPDDITAARLAGQHDLCTRSNVLQSTLTFCLDSSLASHGPYRETAETACQLVDVLKVLTSGELFRLVPGRKCLASLTGQGPSRGKFLCRRQTVRYYGKPKESTKIDNNRTERWPYRSDMPQHSAAVSAYTGCHAFAYRQQSVKLLQRTTTSWHLTRNTISSSATTDCIYAQPQAPSSRLLIPLPSRHIRDNLPADVLLCNTLNTFKCHLKTRLFIAPMASMYWLSCLQAPLSSERGAI